MDAAWKVITEMGCDWCDSQCHYRDGCGCADMVQRGIDDAIAAEREACAKIAEARAKDAEYGTWQAQEGLIIASDIRARSTLKE